MLCFDLVKLFVSFSRWTVVALWRLRRLEICLSVVWPSDTPSPPVARLSTAKTWLTFTSFLWRAWRSTVHWWGWRPAVRCQSGPQDYRTSWPQPCSAPFNPRWLSSGLRPFQILSSFKTSSTLLELKWVALNSYSLIGSCLVNISIQANNYAFLNINNLVT